MFGFTKARPFPPTSVAHSASSSHSAPVAPLHADPALERLPQESLSRLQQILVQLEIVVDEDGADDEGEFHFRDVAADAGARAIAERDEGCFLPVDVALARVARTGCFAFRKAKIYKRDSHLERMRSYGEKEKKKKKTTYLSVIFSHRSGTNSSASGPQISLLWWMV